MTENEISHSIIGAAIEVHRTLGPGLLESAYYMNYNKKDCGLANKSPYLLFIKR